MTNLDIENRFKLAVHYKKLPNLKNLLLKFIE